MLGKLIFNQFKPSQSSKDIPLTININKPPLTDLHVHVDGGTLTQKLVTELAKRNGLPVDYDLFREDGSIYYEENNFLDFLGVYDKVADYIRTAADYEYVTYEYLKSCAVHGTSYVELMFSPDHAKVMRQRYGSQSSSSSLSHSVEELPYQDFVAAIVRGIERAKVIYGIEARIVMALLRHNGTQGCMTTLDEVISYLHPYVVGIDLVGDEAAFPPSLFSSVFQRAKVHGLKTAIHAGEHAPASSIRTTLREINPDRISHGFTSYTDAALVQELAKRNIGLAMCLTSNLRLGVCDDISNHPFVKLLNAGVKVSINTDDPSFWSTSIGNEYKIAQENGNLSSNQMMQLLRNGVETSFAEESLKNKLLAHVALYEAFSKLSRFKGIFSSYEFDHVLEAYAMNRTGVNVTVIINCLERMHAHSSILSGAQNLLRCHQEYIAACKKHELANLKQLERGVPMLTYSSNGMLTDISDEELAACFKRSAQRPRPAFC